MSFIGAVGTDGGVGGREVVRTIGVWERGSGRGRERLGVSVLHAWRDVPVQVLLYSGRFGGRCGDCRSGGYGCGGSGRGWLGIPCLQLQSMLPPFRSSRPTAPAGLYTSHA